MGSALPPGRLGLAVSLLVLGPGGRHGDLASRNVVEPVEYEVALLQRQEVAHRRCEPRRHETVEDGFRGRAQRDARLLARAMEALVQREALPALRSPIGGRQA